MGVNPIPEGYRSVTPYLVVEGAAEFLEFLANVFGATERGERLVAPDGTIGHCEVEIGDSLLMVADPSPDWTPSSPTLMHYVEDCDAVYARAVDAGATPLREPTDQFYGDRSAGVRDRWGNTWWIHTHVEDVPPEEMARRVEELASSQQG